MAFQFVPNSDGSFTEGDKQTNPESGVEYIYHDGAWRHLGAKIEDEFNTLDERYLNLAGTNEMEKYVTFDGQATQGLKFNRSDGDPLSYYYRPDDTQTKTIMYQSASWALFCKNEDNSAQNTMIRAQYKPGTGEATLNLYHVADPVNDTQAANKRYVDSSGGGVPVGTIMIWINSTAPAGWFKLKGSNFDINLYPLLHAYLQKSDGYTSGKLPDWRGHYPGQIGDHLNGDVGIKLGQRTAKPSGGSPKSSHKFNDGHTDSANKAGGTNYADTPTREVVIDTGWDSVTRPKTVAVHFIIKHD